MIVSLADVTLTYGTGATAFTALRGITLDVAAGEMTLLLGPSGSGKTTVLQVMGCLLKPTTGQMQLRVPGVELPADADQEALARVRLACHGFVFQHYNLFPTLRAWENVAIALDLKGRRAAMRERALALLTRLGLAEKAESYPAQLSGGQKQRVAIARALAGEPKVILADEPTAALDGRTGTGVAAVLHALAHEADAAVVVVSHDPRMLPYADRVLTLEDGALTGDRRVTAAERARARETGHHSAP
ncbi:MAG TPA: ABC transporter ATP-binding protein [Xanthomonadales bacterium]|nr:ABC transporter ATP-binding protein [Xanthomonadales bacterium]